MVYGETLIVERRHNQRIVSEAMLLKLAVSSVLSKKADEAFSENIKMLSAD